jgi:DNA-binding SARP family transcriptional activator/predicted ATPase
MPTLILNFLGRFEVNLDGHAIIGFESDKVRSLFAYLAIEAGRPHRRESLAGLFWSENPEPRARQNLSQALYNLRQVLCPDGKNNYLKQNAKEVTFDHQAGVTVDVTQFLHLVHEINVHKHGASWACRLCIGHMQEAVALYQGELLAGFSLTDAEEFEDWLRVQREHLHALIMNLLQDLVKSCTRRGKLAQALSFAERLVSLDRFDENNQRLWLTLLAQKGNRSEAIKQYQAFRRLLADELGVEPEAETVTLYKQISQHFEVFSSLHQTPHNLPASLTPFIGREEELEELYWKLVDPGCRLVTILGIGGSGKTRLAVEVGRNLLQTFRDGIFWVELGVLSSTQDLLAVIAQHLNVRIDMYPIDQRRDDLVKSLFVELRDKEILLILDSAEMVLEAVTPLIELLHTIPSIKILATSRARLNLQGEHLLVLEGLPIPASVSTGWEKTPAVQLFCETARRAKPDFSPSVANADAVIEICRTVQGIPLAIILAAAWAAALYPEQILKKIRENLEFLEVEWKDLPNRQQSLRAAFDYSWALLWEEEKIALRRLAIFHQPFTADQAEKITQLELFHLRSLQDFSLIQLSGQERFRLHDLVRQFAQEKLNEAVQESIDLYQRFSSFYLEKLFTWGKMLKNNQQARALDEMDLEIENASLAWEWAIGNMNLSGMEVVLEGLCNYFDLRWLYRSGARICANGLAELENRAIDIITIKLWARLNTYLGHFWIEMGNEQKGLDLLESIVLELEKSDWGELDLRWEKALALFFITYERSRIDNPYAIQCAMHSAELFKQCGDHWNEARALTYAAAAMESMGKYDDQIVATQRSLQILLPDGDTNLIHYTRYVLGCAYLFKGDHVKGAQIIHDSLRQGRGSRSDRYIVNENYQRAVAHLYSGSFREAYHIQNINYASCLSLNTPFDNMSYLALMIALWGMGRYQEALAELPKIKENVHEIGVPFLVGTIFLLLRQNLQARDEFERAFQAAVEVDDQRLMGGIKAFLSIACYREGDFVRAHNLLSEALQKYQSASSIELSVTLLTVCYFLLERGKVEQAVEVYASATQNPLYGKSAWTQDFLGIRIEQMSQQYPAEVVDAARARGLTDEPKALAATWLGKVDELFH